MNVEVFVIVGFFFSPFFLSSSQTQLTRLHITCEGTIEEHGYGMLQVGMFYHTLSTQFYL